MKRWNVLVLVGLSMTGAPWLTRAMAQPGEESGVTEVDRDTEVDRLTKESGKAFERDDYVAAEGILRRIVKLEPDNFVPWYNLACALSAQGKTEDAGPMLEKAIELGFSDLRQLQIDVHLANLRKTENFKKLVEQWDLILGGQAEQRIEDARKRYGPSYTYEKDTTRRLAYVSAFQPDSFSHAKQEIGRLIFWWENYVCPPASAKPGGTLGTGPWVMVLLPNQKDYEQWARSRYGDAWERIGGVYSHDNKSLIAKDLGSTLRHEFWHVLHWRDMDVRGQRHPIWIMEGLCSLMEDVEVAADGTARPIASWRTNQAGQLARTGKMTPWEVLFKLDQGKFVGSRPLAFYGQSRSIFMWLFEQGKLKEWYAAYTEGYKEDATGLSAFETVFGKPVKKVEADFKAWMRNLPVVAEDFPAGSAVLPFDVEPVGAGDGLVVSGNGALDRLNGRRGGSAGGLMPRDVIMRIDDQPVHEMGQLIRVLGDYGPGTEVTVTYRRLKKVSTTTVRLMRKE